uniref:Uncharacterized protein n=1 Tax=Panagrolaimus sp. PS1159 TaxID=55785 RepID=A0AC35GPR5_9BILA
MKYKPKIPSPAKENVKFLEEETESEGTTRENGPKVNVISFDSRKSKYKKINEKASPPVPPPDLETFQLTIQTIMTGAKPLALTVTKSKTFANIKLLIRSKTKAK